jgi:predicted  nucleic acid-binding Zn-ribbon protein
MTTQELTKADADNKERLSKVEGRMDAQEKRLDKMEEAQKEYGKLLVVVERLANGIDSLREKITDIGGKVDNVCARVNDIEQKPAKRWDTLVSQIITLIVAAGFGYLLSVVVK